MIKGFCVSFSLYWLCAISTESNDSIKLEQHQKQHMQVTATSQWTNRLPWEYILRESVFRTISPPPLANNILHRNILEASFYRGPNILKNGTAGVIRGDVYYLTNGKWLLCQEGCSECEPCHRQTYPTMKWILRRLRKISSYGSSRYDFQLTIIPQPDGSYHMANLWPRAYVYTTSQEELLAHSADTLKNIDVTSAFTEVRSNPSVRHRNTNSFSGEMERHSTVGPVVIDKSNISRTSQNLLTVTTSDSITSTTVKNRELLENGQKSENKQRLRNFRKQRPSNRTTEKPVASNRSTLEAEVENSETKQTMPQLILGTDQQGQKHLVHVVSAENRPAAADFVKQSGFNVWSLPSGAPTKLLFNSSKPDYHHLLQKIFNSLVTHRRSIEQFLQSPDGNVNLKKGPASTILEGVEMDKRQETNSSIEFYQNETNKSQSSIGTPPPIVPDQSRDRRQCTPVVNASDTLNSIETRKETIDKCFTMSSATHNSVGITMADQESNVSGR